MFDKLFRTAAAAIALSLASPALAHTGLDGTHSFAAGFAHPLGGADHLLAMLVVGLLAGIMPARGWLAPAGFMAGMTAGAILGFAGAALPAVEPMIALSVLALGGLLALGPALPALALAGAAAVFALFHGAAHAAEAPLGIDGALYLAGFLMATAGAHGIGYAAMRTAGPALRRLLAAGAGTAAAFAGGLMLAGL